MARSTYIGYYVWDTKARRDVVARFSKRVNVVALLGDARSSRHARLKRVALARHLLPQLRANATLFSGSNRVSDEAPPTPPRPGAPVGISSRHPWAPWFPAPSRRCRSRRGGYLFLLLLSLSRISEASALRTETVRSASPRFFIRGADARDGGVHERAPRRRGRLAHRAALGEAAQGLDHAVPKCDGFVGIGLLVMRNAAATFLELPEPRTRSGGAMSTLAARRAEEGGGERFSVHVRFVKDRQWRG